MATASAQIAGRPAVDGRGHQLDHGAVRIFEVEVAVAIFLVRLGTFEDRDAFGAEKLRRAVHFVGAAEPERDVIHPRALAPVVRGRVRDLVERDVVKAVSHALHIVAILAEVEPRDRALVLEGDGEPERLRVEADRAIEIGDVQVHVCDVDGADHPRRSRSRWKRWSVRCTSGVMSTAAATSSTKPQSRAYTPAKSLPAVVRSGSTGPIPPRIIAAFTNAS